MDGTNWQGSPTFTGLSPNTAYTFYARLKEDANHNASPASVGASIITRKTTINDAAVQLSETRLTYDGTGKTPAVTIKKGTNTDSDSEYQITCSNTNDGDGDHTHAGTVTVTVAPKDSGGYSGSASTAFTINSKVLPPGISGTTTKAYDGATDGSAGLTIQLDGVMGGDHVTAAASSAYNSENVKDGNTIAVSFGYEVSTANDDFGTVVPSGSISDHLGKALYIRKVEDNNHAASGWTAFTPAARPPAPPRSKLRRKRI